MGQLQSDEQPFLRTRRLSVFINLDLPQLSQSFFRMLGNQELIGIRAPFTRNRNCLASPNQFCSASPKFFPSFDRMLARVSVGSAVPSFHRLNRDSVAD